MQKKLYLKQKFTKFINNENFEFDRSKILKILNSDLLEDDYKTIKKVILSSYNRLALTYMNSPDRKELGTPHFVSQISNGCAKYRISITGWVS